MKALIGRINGFLSESISGISVIQAFSKEKNKAWEKSLAAATVGRCVTWCYICLTFSFVGYDVVGLIG